jgi:pyroglutamyl-peptidase
MKFLIYGFEPFGKYKENVTEKIVGSIPSMSGLEKIVFPVKFDREQFTDAVKKYSPDIILGMGQHPRGGLIRIERKAVNLKRDRKGKKPEQIIPGKPDLFTSLRLEDDEDSWISYNSGLYVCNFSMYILSDFVKDTDTKYGFLHIPQDYLVRKAVSIIGRRMDEMIERYSD